MVFEWRPKGGKGLSWGMIWAEGDPLGQERRRRWWRREESWDLPPRSSFSHSVLGHLTKLIVEQMYQSQLQQSRLLTTTHDGNTTQIGCKEKENVWVQVTENKPGSRLYRWS